MNRLLRDALEFPPCPRHSPSSPSGAVQDAVAPDSLPHCDYGHPSKNWSNASY
jgi:hypothetical protein